MTDDPRSSPAAGDRGRRYTVYEMAGARAVRRRRRVAVAAVAMMAVVAVGGGAALVAAGWVGPAGGDRSTPGALEARAPEQTVTSAAGGDASSPGSTSSTSPGGAAEPDDAMRGGDPGGGASLPASYAPINTGYAGLSMFRGNGHRAYYGRGPVPSAPRVLWRFPETGPMSSPSSEGGKTRIWAGTGWTGQPVVVEREGMTQVMFGAYDRAVHFLDGSTGGRFLPDLPTGDIIKGSVMADPDGFPLLYTGSRDNYFRVVALDRQEPETLWKLNAADVPEPVWNNDWDSSALVIGDYLFEGGENSYFYIVRLNRDFDSQGRVKVDPRVVLAYPAYDRELIEAVGDRRVSIENSPAVHLDPERGDRVYFANGGGRIVGLDISALGLSAAGYGPAGQAPGTWEGGVSLEVSDDAGAAARAAVRASPPLPAEVGFPVAFRYWAGDDIDASIVVDDDGRLYVGVELERMLARAREVGQLIKLDPYALDDPLVWSVADSAGGGTAGVWATPALHGDLLYATTHTGRLLGVDRHTGTIRWEKSFTFHAWSSPVVVDDTLIVGDTDGWLHAYDVSRPGVDPPELWEVRTQGGGAIESTPAVWDGRIYVGSRDGYFYSFGDP